jgi:hypothetical protein
VPLAGEYLFNNTLSSNNGAPALIATNPVGTPGFSIDTVFGTSRTVYSYTGNTSSPSAEGGLTLDTTGLLGSNALWSAEIDFKFNPGGGNWRRIIDVQNRSSDDGFYVDPGDSLIIYPDQVTSANGDFTTGDYNRVFIAVGSGSASFWLGTSSRTTTATSVMAINNPGNLLNLFLDNTGDYGTDWASGSIAYFALYNGTLNDSDVAQLAARPLPDGVPEPGTVSLLGIAFSAIGIALRRARA